MAEEAQVAAVIVGIVGYKSAEMISSIVSDSRHWLGASFEIHICENGGPQSFAELADTMSRIEAVATIDAPQPGPRVLQTKAFLLGGHRIVLHEASDNLGYSGGINVALQAVQNSPGWKAFWVLNPDTRPEPDALANALRYLVSGNYGIVGTRLVYTQTGRVQQYGGRWRIWLGRGFNVGRGADPAQRPDVAAVEKEINYASGASLMASREFIDAAGPMDERYFLFSEEVDWCLRRGQMKIGYAHDAVVHHIQGATIGSNESMASRSELSIYCLERSGPLLTRKFYPWALPIVAICAPLYSLRYLRKGGWSKFICALSGVLAGLKGETGIPRQFQR